MRWWLTWSILSEAGGAAVLLEEAPPAPPRQTDRTPVADAPTSLLPSAAKTRPPTAAGESPAVEVRAGEHGSYNRLVFTWPQAVDYKVEKQGGRATIVFAKPSHLDIPGLQSTLPSDITANRSTAGPRRRPWSYRSGRCASAFYLGDESGRRRGSVRR